MAKLGEVCTIVSGSTPKTSVTSYWDGNIKWITPAELNEDTFYIMDSVRHITEDGKEKTGLSYLPTGTVILSSRAPIGKTAIAGCEMCCNQGFKNLICSDAIYNEYLYFFLKSKTDYLNSLGRGATFKEISKSIVENIEIPLPEVNQQKEIAEKFKKLEQLISLRKQQLEKLDELVKARFVEKSKEWQAVPGQLNEFLEDITYGFTNPMPDAEEGPWKVTAKDVVNGHINILTARKTTNEAFERLTNKSKPRKGDVLLTKDGTLGRVAVVDVENLCVNQSVAVMRCNNKIYPEFLAMILQMPEYQRKLLEDSGGGTIKHLYITKVDKMLISVPDLVIQKALLMFAKRVEQQKQTVQQSLEKLELMKKALMQEHFG